MVLGTPGRKSAPLGVIWIALALVVAAFLGASIGLVWQSSGLEEDEVEVEPATKEEPAD